MLHSSVDEPWKLNISERSQIHEANMLYDFFYTKYPE